MARRHPILRGLVILTAVTLGLVVLAVGLALLGGRGDEVAEQFTFGNSVGVVEVRGVIKDAGDTVEALDRLGKQDRTVGVVLRVESPGGAVAPAQEIYDAVWRLRDAKKPVVASLGNVAASAGYYIASAANQIVASPGTLTASIGVIMELPYYAVLAEKVGVSEEIIKSGPFKDIGHPLRPMTPEERALLQTMIDDVLAQFVDAVAHGRGLPSDEVRAIADGRVMTGAQALSVGLIDRLGGLVDATQLAWELGGETGEPRVTKVPSHERPWWVQLLTGALAGRLVGPQPLFPGGGALSVYRGPTIE